MTLEICCFDINSCRIAQENGADRIELCANPFDGGTTPSIGFIEAARRLLTIDLYPIIRPRGGDFLYDEEAFSIMYRDIQVCKELGCNGVVIGMLDKYGAVDLRRTARLVSVAYPMEVTFHRAFDRAADPPDALEKIISAGCTRILSSGQRPTAVQGMNLLAELVRLSDNRITIMPGSGVRANNILSLREGTGAAEFHSTARKPQATGMAYFNPAMEEEMQYDSCDGEEVARMKALLTNG